jgi:hypothetical protein
MSSYSLLFQQYQTAFTDWQYRRYLWIEDKISQLNAEKTPESPVCVIYLTKNDHNNALYGEGNHNLENILRFAKSHLILIERIDLKDIHL